METAKAELGKMKVPVFFKQELSTESININAFGMEMNPLSEISPQMFSVKGVAREIKEINKETFEKAMVEVAISQPKYTRKPNKPRNFKNKIRNEDATTTFTFISNKNGKEYNVTYDKDGFPGITTCSPHVR